MIVSRQAAAHRVDIGAYAASLLEEATRVSVEGKKLSQNQLEETLQELAQFSQKIPLLPDEAFSRESLTWITTDELAMFLLDSLRDDDDDWTDV
jgi:hypothetical protein